MLKLFQDQKALKDFKHSLFSSLHKKTPTTHLSTYCYQRTGSKTTVELELIR